MEKIAVYPGSFDPITNGHIDVIERSAELFDKVIVVIAINPNKTTLFTLGERTYLAMESLKHIKNVEIESYNGLIVDFAIQRNAIALIRGIRAVTDFEFEFQLSLMNRKLAPNIKTILMMPNEKYTYLNSSIIRELARFQQDVSEFVPKVVVEKFKEKFSFNQ